MILDIYDEIKKYNERFLRGYRKIGRRERTDIHTFEEISQEVENTIKYKRKAINEKNNQSS